MATFQNGDRGSFPAGADLTGKRYHIVKLDSNGAVVLATAGTDAIIGVLDNEPKAGGTAEVVLINGQGTFKVKAGADIAKDAYITAGSGGLAAATTTSGHRVIGRNLIAAAVNGEVFEYVKSNEKY